MKIGIAPEHLAQLRAIFGKHPQIVDAVLYGSRAKGTQREGSDIDVALKGAAIDARILTQIDAEYDTLYLPWKLDLCVYEQIVSPELRSHIDRVGISLMARPQP